MYERIEQVRKQSIASWNKVLGKFHETSNSQENYLLQDSAINIKPIDGQPNISKRHMN